MEFIRFLQPDPDYKVVPSEVVISVGQIVKLEPRYFETSGGKRFLTQVTKYGEEELMKGIERLYIVYDSLGNKYSSETASDEGRAVIERIWMSAK
jgi:hypothetical protein